LSILEQRVHVVANLTAGREYLERQRQDMQCMNDSAAQFYNGKQHNPPRVLWPDECTRVHVSESLTRTVCEPPVRTQKTECIETNGVQKFVAALSGIKRCKTFWVEPKCRRVADEDAQKALLALIEEKELLDAANAANVTMQDIADDVDRNERAKDAISRVLAQVDIASNLYIGYTIMGLIFTQPLVIFKRSKRARLSGLTLGLNKVTFTVLVIVLMTLYDAVSSILRMTDVQALMSNFHQDPCWVDPEFGRSRADFIVRTCDNVASLHASSNNQIHKLDDMYSNVKLFGLCEANGKRSEHPHLSQMDHMRLAYKLENNRNPATCNVTLMNQSTDTPSAVLNEEQSSSALKSLFLSGILAQILLKIVATNVMVHATARIEPLGFYDGRVEVMGDFDLSKEEEDAVRRFASDQHILPLILSVFLLVSEICLLVFAAAHEYRTGEGSSYFATVTDVIPHAYPNLSGLQTDMALSVCRLL
jgi:hypothetical protein